MSIVTEIEKQALSLSDHDRAKLAERLWQSIPDDFIDDKEIEELLRRDREMDEDPDSVMSHDEFFNSLREHVK